MAAARVTLLNCYLYKQGLLCTFAIAIVTNVNHSGEPTLEGKILSITEINQFGLEANNELENDQFDSRRLKDY